MAIGRNVATSVVQCLRSLDRPAADLIVTKYLELPAGVELDAALVDVILANEAGSRAIALDLVLNSQAHRHDATPRHRFDTNVADLSRQLFLNGWEVTPEGLAAVGPAVEEVTGLKDALLDALAASGLDEDEAVKKCLKESDDAFVRVPPDFNDATTKARIALETVVRRAAAKQAADAGIAAPEDKWGAALLFLRQQGKFNVDDEKMIAAGYTFISPGAHVPAGMSAEDWARLARTISISSLFFVLKAS